MKVRKGFVSNSSSSSFIIATTASRLTLDNLLEAFAVPEGSPLFKVACDMAQVMLDKATKYDEKEILYNWGYKSLEEALEDGNQQAQLIERGFTVYSGYASDEDGGIEAMICNTKIDFESDHFVLKSEGGY